MRAISVLSFDAGTSTLGWRAAMALRTRVSISAIGSLVIWTVTPFLPAGLYNARNLAIEGQLPETQAAHAVFAEESARTSAAPAAVPMTAPELRSLFRMRDGQLYIFGDFGGCCHSKILFSRLLPMIGGTAYPSA